jgi:predicted nucleic acid-binding protein
VILVDSSVWIDSFKSHSGPAGAELRRMIEEGEPLVLTGIVIAEVLQGLTRDAAHIEHFLAQWDLIEPKGFETYRRAASVYREARAKGTTLSTIDTLIASIALDHRASVFTLDQDFTRIARLTKLELYAF